jgi:omega-6 fatty acid desaturase (delta-12 desaturase)
MEPDAFPHDPKFDLRMQTSQTDFRALLARYREPSTWRACVQVLTTLVPLFGLWALMYFLIDVAYGAVLLLTIPAAGLLMRVFIIQHDCGHGSFLKSRLANDVLGRICSILTLTPYHCWRKLHAIHHATSGDLDRRGHGDIHTLTVAEYLALGPWKRFTYRLYRNPLVLFGIGPFLQFAVIQRFNFGMPRSWTKERHSTYLTNALLAATVLCLSLLMGFWKFALIYLPCAALGASIGVWLFYVQHQFEETYWQDNETWDFFKAGIKGSSYYALPPVLQWFTANIGIHHLHHLDHLIPNYRLEECMNQHPELRAVNRITLGQSLACVRLKLWDERQGKMVSFRDIKARLEDVGGTHGSEETLKVEV